MHDVAVNNTKHRKLMHEITLCVGGAVMEKWTGENSAFLRIGFGGIFLLTNSIVLLWADLAGKVMGALETGNEINGSISQLACFMILSIGIYIFLIFANRKLIAVFEKGMIPIQERYIEQDLMKSGKSKKYSELELINRVSDDLRTVITWSYQTKTEFILSIVLLLGIFLYLSHFSIVLAIAIYAIMFVNLLIPVLYNKHMVADYSQVMQANDNWAKRLQEGIENYAGIKGLNAEAEYHKIYEKEVLNFVGAVKIANRTAHMEMGLKSGMNQFSNYAGYIAAGFFAVSGQIDLATVARSVLLIPLIQNILSLVMEKYVHRRKVIVSKQRLMEFTGKGMYGDKVPASYDMQIKHLEFDFEDHKLFHDLNYEMKTGEKVIIKGENGAGKSTLLKLLTGFYEMQGGEIRIGGVCHKDIREDWIVSNIFYLPQNNLFIPGTVEENLRLRGIDTAVVEKSYLSKNIKELSEGQKKKIVLEELYRTDKKILLLDEPENHLDTAVLNELATFLENEKRTVIIVSHVDAFDSMADKIWRLEKES